VHAQKFIKIFFAKFLMVFYTGAFINNNIMNFDSIVNILLESTNNAIAQQFQAEVLDNYIYKTSGQGHLNCSWATCEMCKWGESKGYNMQAIYFVWPTPEIVKSLKSKSVLPSYYEDEGMSHIAPIYNNYIIDFTIGQFSPNEKLKITPVKQWESVYGPFGYGQNSWPEGSGKTVYIDTFDNLYRNKDLTIHPMPPKAKSSNIRMFCTSQ